MSVEKSFVVYHNIHQKCHVTFDSGGGVVRLESKRCFSPTEMFARLSMSGVISDIKAHTRAIQSRPEYIAMREAYYKDCDNRSCPPRGSYVDGQDYRQAKKNVDDRLSSAFKKGKESLKKDIENRQKEAFEKAVDAEVSRRLSDPKNVG